MESKAIEEPEGDGKQAEEARGRADIDSSTLPIRPFYPNQWLDVMDTHNQWLEAQVIQVEDADDGESIYVHYKGWKDKFDERLDMGEGSAVRHRVRPALTEFIQHPPRCDQRPELRVSVRLDVHDTSEKWCKATITEVINEPPNRFQVKVSYDGWSSKFDEWINSDSYRLAPLHYYTDPPASSQQQRPPPLNRSNSNYRPPAGEESRFADDLKRVKGWSIRPMAGDGNCLFRSISYQIYGDAKHHSLLREKCMDYVEAERNFFSNYIDGDAKVYIQRMRRDGEWGDNVEIQALSEIYSRRVEIYAYSAEPMKTYQRHLGGSNPIRISYHCGSHYNTIEYPEIKSKWLNSEPGVWEDRVIAASRSRERTRPNTQTQDQELKLALEVSRQEFKRGGHDNFDVQIQRAIQLSKGGATGANSGSTTSPMQQAVLNSLGVSPEESALQRALQASMMPTGSDTGTSELERAIAASLVLSHNGNRAVESSSNDPEAENDKKNSNNNGDKKERSPAARDTTTTTQSNQGSTSNRESTQEKGGDKKDDGSGNGGGQGHGAAIATQSPPQWLEELVGAMGLSRERALRGYNRFKNDDVSEEIMKRNIINYCLAG
eukprot:jgi/Bigna1/86001/estExt_fgenesh1_pg.C_70228